MSITPKKHLGQHFLTHEPTAQKIAFCLNDCEVENLLEIGPGMGVMTKYLKNIYPNAKIKLVEVDEESIHFLGENLPDFEVINADFLQLDLGTLFNGEFSIIGNFPYYISTQIMLKVINNHELIHSFGGMFQKEVSEKICASPNDKSYGIISILSQAFYHTEYLFTVPKEVFNPPPKVESGVIKLIRKKDELGCDSKKFTYLVKKSFNLRRKMLRKSLKSDFTTETLTNEVFTKRPENLTVNDFVYLVKLMDEK